MLVGYTPRLTGGSVTMAEHDDGYGPECEALWQRWRSYVDEVRAGGRPAFEEQLETFERIYGDWPAAAGPPPAWRPGPEELEGSNLARFMAEVGVGSYRELHRWSVTHRGEFWQRVIDRLGIVLEQPPDRILDESFGPLHPRWLPGARLNIADSCFQRSPCTIAIAVGREGSDEVETVTFGELEALADRFSAGLERLGLKPGDPVALYMPMTLECIAAYLGAVRAGCPVVSIADSFSAEELVEASGDRRGAAGGDGRRATFAADEPSTWPPSCVPPAPFGRWWCRRTARGRRCVPATWCGMK